jgi:hypothetical protein
MCVIASGWASAAGGLWTPRSKSAQTSSVVQEQSVAVSS